MHRFIKAVGSGRTRARDLERDEARAAMGLIADGEARPEQIGAFLLALRMKGEAAAELIGFAEALAARVDAGGARAPAGTVDVECHGDGHAGRPSLLPATAAALAALGIPVLLRLQLDCKTTRHGLVAALAALGLDLGRPLDGPRAARALERGRLALLDLDAYAAPLGRLMALRPLLGVRTVAQTLPKLLDPLGAAVRVAGVFHAPYLPTTAAALAALAPTPFLCVQALGGLPEAAPAKIVRVCDGRPPAPRTLDLRALVPAAASEAAKTDAVKAEAAKADADGDDDPASSAAALADAAAARDNLGALAGEAEPAARAIAAAALLLHAARGVDLDHAVTAVRDAITSGAARAAAAAWAEA